MRRRISILTLGGVQKDFTSSKGNETVVDTIMKQYAFSLTSTPDRIETYL